MPERSCPACHEPVAAHQTLCPSCRTPVPSAAGPVAADSAAFTFAAPPPRQPRGADPAASDADTAPPALPPAPVQSPGDDTGAARPFPVGPQASGSQAGWPQVSGREVSGREVSGREVSGSQAGGPQVSGPDSTAVAGGWLPTAPGTEVTWAAPPAAPEQAPAGPVGPVAPVAGTLGSSGAAELDERGNLPGGLTGLVAAAVVAVGVFLPWIRVGDREVSGWAASDDAKVLLGIAGLATIAAALLIGGARSLVLRLGMVVLGVATVGLAAYDIASARGVDGLDVSLGTGLVVVLVGGAALVIAGALARHRRFR